MSSHDEWVLDPDEDPSVYDCQVALHAAKCRLTDAIEGEPLSEPIEILQEVVDLVADRLAEQIEYERHGDRVGCWPCEASW